MGGLTIEKEREISKFFEGHILACASMLIDELYRNEKYMDKLISAYIQDNWLDAARDKGYKGKGEEGARKFCENKHIDPYESEALEHWFVSGWLADRLIERGEMVIKDFFGLNVWGRICSGQAIIVDGVIQEIWEATK